MFLVSKTVQKLDPRMRQVFPEQSLEPLPASSYPQERERAMPKTKSYVGIDISKDYLDLHQLPQDKAARFETTPEGKSKLITYLKRRKPSLIVIEGLRLLR